MRDVQLTIGPGALGEAWSLVDVSGDERRIHTDVITVDVTPREHDDESRDLDESRDESIVFAIRAKRPQSGQLLSELRSGKPRANCVSCVNNRVHERTPLCDVLRARGFGDERIE